MKEQVTKSERLSALVDGETDDFETRRLIDELVKSEEDRSQWERYHLIGDSLRGGLRNTAPAHFMDDIRTALADEPALQGVPRRESPRWLKPVAGTGVAAAVAMVTLVGMQMLGDRPGQDATPVAVESGTPAAAGDVQTASSRASAEDSAQTEVGESLDPRFARYLENHAELTGPGSSALGRVRYSVSDE
ncbi:MULTISPECIES: sigma-E factor negative regulatory protein [unclassified Thioalkalivibrio]|uniref:sigma-E factor negative regulatory protein n=1 Tax=unclassified Thioalkalivibrio TaxID=2621013 RepID=UPI0003665E8F|nr:MULTISPECIES: sigma-E factor negative regulatory protein [unclassified Thioalkalivibrio]